MSPVESSFPRRPIVIGAVAAALMTLGVALRINAYLANYSISLDEAAIARNIIDRTWIDLLGPLDYAQIAPPAFLLVEKAVVSLFGSGEYALRAFPVLCGLVSVYLFWRLADRLIAPVPALCALGLFVANVSLIGYPARLKQYSSDVAAALIILLMAAALFDHALTRSKALWLGIAGAFTVLFSFTAVFVLAAAALTALVRALSESAERRRILVMTSALWIVGALVGILIGRLALTPTDAAYMRWFWQPGFMPLPIRSRNDVLWVWHQIMLIFRWTGLYHASIGWAALTVIGAWSIRRRIDHGLLVVVPVLLVILASATRQYPFVFGRIDLFLTPMLLLLVAEGAEWCREWVPRRLRLVGFVPLIIVAALAAEALWTDSRQSPRNNLRVDLEELMERRQAGDAMYVEHHVGIIFLYYAPRLGLSPSDFVLGSCSGETVRTPLREVDGLRGRRRVWMITPAFDSSQPLERYLRTIGKLQDVRETEDPDMQRRVSLYDLAPSVPALVTADTFPLTEPEDKEAIRWNCYGVLNPYARNG